MVLLWSWWKENRMVTYGLLVLFRSRWKMVTGLASVGNQQYYFNQSGAMQTGWIQADGTYYYANNSGLYSKRLVA